MITIININLWSPYQVISIFFLEKTWKIVISSLITCQFQSMTVKWLAEVDVPDLIDRSRRNPEYDSSNPKDTHRTYVVLCHGFTS